MDLIFGVGRSPGERNGKSLQYSCLENSMDRGAWWAIVHGVVRCWSWNSNTLATWWEELTYLKRPWCWERLRAGEEGDDRGCDGWMASPTQWTWVWVGSGSWWWTGRPGVLWFMGLQRVGHYWATTHTLLPHSKFICWILNPPWLYLEIGAFKVVIKAKRS